MSEINSLKIPKKSTIFAASSSKNTKNMNASWILIIVIGIVGLLVQWKLKSVFAKYSKVLSPGGLTGAQIAQKNAQRQRYQ